MAIKKISDGKYRIDFRDKLGRRFRYLYDTRKKADEALTEAKSQVRHGKFVAPRTIPRFKQTAEEWLAGKSDRRPGTVVNWKAHVNRHLLPRLGAMRLDCIGVREIEKMRDDLRKAGLSPRSISAIMATASAIFNLAIHHKQSATNPAAEAERPFCGASEIILSDSNAESNAESGGNGDSLDETDVLNPAEVRKLLDASDPGLWRTLFLTAFLTGMRSGELFACRWGDLELGDNAQRGKIHVRRSLSWARTDGEEGPVRPKFYPPKTKKGTRDIPISAELATALKVWKLACPKSGLDLVFPTSDGSPIRRSDALKIGFRPALRRARLRQVTMHSLRHSFASALIMGGASIVEVQGLLGHSKPTVTLDVYSHWFKGLKTDSVDKLARTLADVTKAEAQSTPQPQHATRSKAARLNTDPAIAGHFLDTPSRVEGVAADAISA